MPTRPKISPVRQPSLFEFDKLERVLYSIGKLEVRSERPHMLTKRVEVRHRGSLARRRCYLVSSYYHNIPVLLMFQNAI